jgi:hypothetical protein
LSWSTNMNLHQVFTIRLVYSLPYNLGSLYISHNIDHGGSDRHVTPDLDLIFIIC